MSTGWKFNNAGLILCLGAFCVGIAGAVTAASGQTQPANAAPQSKPANAIPSKSEPKTKKTKKAQKAALPALPSGPTGPVQPIPLDSMAPVPPQVTYQDAQLTIVAPNSTLGDILRAIRKQTGAEIEIPTATERVVTHLGPGPAREVISELLNGSRFNYVLLGSSANSADLTRVVLVAKGGADAGNANPSAMAEQQQSGLVPHTGNPGAALPQQGMDAAEAEAAPEDNTDDAADQAAAEAEQQPPPSSPDQNAVKTPQQMLQEMQQRQLQLQQQQSGQQPATGPTPRPQEQ